GGKPDAVMRLESANGCFIERRAQQILVHRSPKWSPPGRRFVAPVLLRRAQFPPDAPDALEQVRIFGSVIEPIHGSTSRNQKTSHMTIVQRKKPRRQIPGLGTFTKRMRSLPRRPATSHNRRHGRFMTRAHQSR